MVVDLVDSQQHHDCISRPELSVQACVLPHVLNRVGVYFSLCCVWVLAFVQQLSSSTQLQDFAIVMDGMQYVIAVLISWS